LFAFEQLHAGTRGQSRPVSCRRLRGAAEEPVWTVARASGAYPQTAPDRRRRTVTYRGTAAAAGR
jgi:hypothetical protein